MRGARRFLHRPAGGPSPPFHGGEIGRHLRFSSTTLGRVARRSLVNGALALAGLLLATSLAIASPLERIEPRLARAIEENRVFLTCTSVDAGAFDGAERYWKRMVERAREFLVTNGASADELAAFDKRTAVPALLQDDRPLSEAIALCRNHADWFRRYGKHDFVTRIDDSPLPERR